MRKGYRITELLKSLDELPGTLTEGIPDPEANGKNEILVDVHCAGLNFFDLLQVQGKYQIKPPLPFVAGCEFSGLVSKNSPIPKGCPFVPGKTRVFGAAQGAYSERVSLDWRSCIELPHNMRYEEAAGLYITYPTSYAALTLRARLQPNEWVLIHAAAGGVGLSALQIAKALGAKVIATASTADKLAVCSRAGADHIINYKTEDWQKKVMEITKGKGADVVYDSVGMLIPSLKCIAWNGRLVVVGFAGGTIEKVPANLILLKNIEVTGVHWGAYTKNEPQQITKVWGALLELLKSGKLKPMVFEGIYEGLESLPQGLADLSARKTWGKAVVRVVPSQTSSKL